MFRNVRGEGDEQGYVSGAFIGSDHEHMGGTLKRTDVVAAFGGSMSRQSAEPTPQEDILLAELLPDPSHSFRALSASHRKDWAENAVSIADSDIVRSIAGDGNGGFVVTNETPEHSERVVEFDPATHLGDRPGYNTRSIDGFGYWLYSMTGAFSDGPSNAGSPQFDYFEANTFTATGGGLAYRSFLVYGVETEAVPMAGTATYSGRMLGHMHFEDDPANETSLHWIRGTLALEADFGARTISGSIDSIGIRPPGADVYRDDPMTLSIAASPIEDSGFAGRWSEDGGGFAGEVEARFLGPAANEVGGVMSGTNPGEGLTLVGFIGGKQQRRGNRLRAASSGRPPSGVPPERGTREPTVLATGDLSSPLL